MAQKKSKKLNPKQLLAAELMGQGYRHKDVAKQLKIRDETLSRWLSIEAFRKHMNQANRALRANILSDTTSLINKCHLAINEALDHEESLAKRASLAIRYLANYSKPYTAYDKLNELQRSDESRSEFVRAMSQINAVIRQLGFLKSSNSQYTDAEFREAAEKAVRNWGQIDEEYWR